MSYSLREKFYSNSVRYIAASLVVILAISTIVLFSDELFPHSVALSMLALTALTLVYVFARKLSDTNTGDLSSSVERLAAAVEAVSKHGGEAVRDGAFAQELTPIVHALQEVVQSIESSRSEMQRLETVRSQFIANVSHELRTPIFAIQGYLETLLDGAIDDASVRRNFLNKANTNAARLNTLLGDLIDISRIESGEMRLSLRYFNICDLAAETVQTLENLATQYSVSVEVKVASDEITVLGDKERIAQVLSNLISNAIRYNRKDGRVLIEIARSDDATQVSIQDTGIGIPAEHQSRIFERFYRVDANRSRNTGGSGLGLAIVKHILEAHDSAPHLQSQPGVGTTISFVLHG